MFSKLIVVALISAAVAAPQHHTAAQFPAGVDPLKCPGFPICDNLLLHSQQPSAPSWNSQPHQSQWEQSQQQWNSQPQQQWNSQPQQQWNQPEAQKQWNQPESQKQWNQPQPQQQWNHQQQAASYQAPSNHLSNDQITGAGGDKYPAGVDPKSCPNYPYCDGAASHSAVAVAAPPPLPGYNERQYPAGVSPHSCPNFPYCN